MKSKAERLSPPILFPLLLFESRWSFAVDQLIASHTASQKNWMSDHWQSPSLQFAHCHRPSLKCILQLYHFYSWYFSWLHTNRHTQSISEIPPENERIPTNCEMSAYIKYWHPDIRMSMPGVNNDDDLMAASFSCFAPQMKLHYENFFVKLQRGLIDWLKTETYCCRWSWSSLLANSFIFLLCELEHKIDSDSKFSAAEKHQNRVNFWRNNQRKYSNFEIGCFLFGACWSKNRVWTIIISIITTIGYGLKR